mmetsp:Transcript_41046/g.123928  ORF Transcript_41046/g.123928 Transcript_41046/m.123928 type:complete len:157 (-) Transcript_41046:1-471(-)
MTDDGEEISHRPRDDDDGSSNGGNGGGGGGGLIECIESDMRSGREDGASEGHRACERVVIEASSRDLDGGFPEKAGGGGGGGANPRHAAGAAPNADESVGYDFIVTDDDDSSFKPNADVDVGAAAAPEVNVPRTPQKKKKKKKKKSSERKKTVEAK